METYFSRYSRNSEAFASEFHEYLEKCSSSVLHAEYVYNMFKSSWALYCVVCIYMIKKNRTQFMEANRCTIVSVLYFDIVQGNT